MDKKTVQLGCRYDIVVTENLNKKLGNHMDACQD